MEDVKDNSRLFRSNCPWHEWHLPKVVIPAKAGIQRHDSVKSLDSCLTSLGLLKSISQE
jgi:hypothetical protein